MIPGITQMPMVGSAGGYNFVNAEAAAYVNAMPTKPDDTRKGVIDTFFTDLKAVVSLSKFDALYLLAAHASNAAIINAINPGTYDCTIVSGCAFSADNGFTGDGVADYLDTNAQSDSLTAFQQNSAHLGVWTLTNVSAGSNPDIGTPTTDELRINSRNGSNVLVSKVNTATSTSDSVANSLGHTVANRSGATASQTYRAGSSLGSDTQTSAALNAENIHILSANGNFGTRQIAVAHFGASLTATEVGNIKTALNTYLTAVGAV